MEYLRSLGYLFRGVLKRIYWLIPALATDPFDVLDRLGVHMNIPPVVSWILVGIGFAIAILLTYHEQRIEKEKELSKETSLILAKPIVGFLKYTHILTLREIEQQMETVHGHSDTEGLESDFRRGVLASDLMQRNCTRCGKPRNQQGDFVI